MSSRVGRPVVVLVRLLLVLRIAQWEEMKTSLVLNHQLCKNSELAQVFATLYSAGTLETEGKGNLSGLTLNTSSTDNVLLTQVSRLPSCVSGEGVVLCSGAPMGTRVVAHSVGTASTSDLAVARGCIGKARVPNPSPFPLVVGFSLPGSV